MRKASMTLHPSYRIGSISPRLFGAFLEPIGSMVNGSMYNPKHPTADEPWPAAGLYRRACGRPGFPALRLPGRQLRLRMGTGRIPSAPGRSAKHGWTWPGTSLFPTMWDMTNTCSGPSSVGAEPHVYHQPGHRFAELDAIRPGGVYQLSRKGPIGRTCGRQYGHKSSPMA